ncbi:MAG TPA: hypothetical protein VLH61_11810 [Bacteroidales bacterium]|nr:hypothetical protein [Bacteroidales bacterium]
MESNTCNWREKRNVSPDWAIGLNKLRVRHVKTALITGTTTCVRDYFSNHHPEKEHIGHCSRLH